MNKHKLKQKKEFVRERANRKGVSFHVYRSINESLPFIFLELLTDEPIRDGNFNDPAAEIGQRFYFSLDFTERTGKVS